MTKEEFQRLDYDERRRLVIGVLRSLSRTDGTLKLKEWNMEKPGWCPTARWAAAYVQCVTEEQYKEALKYNLASWVLAMDVLGMRATSKYKPPSRFRRAKSPTKIIDEIQEAWDYIDKMWKFKPKKDNPRAGADSDSGTPSG